MILDILNILYGIILFMSFTVGLVIIIRKAGYSGWWYLILFVPLLNIISIYMFAFKTWPSLQGYTEISENEKSEKQISRAWFFLISSVFFSFTIVGILPLLISARSMYDFSKNRNYSILYRSTNYLLAYFAVLLSALTLFYFYDIFYNESEYALKIYGSVGFLLAYAYLAYFFYIQPVKYNKEWINENWLIK